ncbi:MAG: clan AA aspartic protease [Betaproteobacteria bacterium]|nr:clan AA aspartic protease [Betaproteobacteria bacterium]
MAVVVIDGGRPRTLKAGDVTPEKVRLISATSEVAVFEIAGKRQTLGMGQSISVGGASSAGQRASIVGDLKGHFFTMAAVNGVSIRFLIDTGATLVTISSADARRAGVNYLTGQRVVMQTASGIAPGYRVKFDTVRLGEIVLNNVDGIVVEGNALGNAALLGMSFLNRTEMKRESDTMTLTRRY